MSEQVLTPFTFEGPELSGNDYLRFVQNRRMQFIKSIHDCMGDDIGGLDPDRQANYLAALRDIEKQVQFDKKLEADKESNAASNAMIAEMILKSAKERNSLETKAKKAKVVFDENLLPKKELIPGETDIGDRIENHQEYKTRTGQIVDQDP